MLYRVRWPFGSVLKIVYKPFCVGMALPYAIWLTATTSFCDLIWFVGQPAQSRHRITVGSSSSRSRPMKSPQSLQKPNSSASILRIAASRALIRPCRRVSCAAAIACCCIASIRLSRPTLCWSSSTGLRSAAVSTDASRRARNSFSSLDRNVAFNSSGVGFVIATTASERQAPCRTGPFRSSSIQSPAYGYGCAHRRP